MDGRLVPTGLGALGSFWRDLIDNITTVQFNHRIGAYALTAAIVAHAWICVRSRRPRPRHAHCFSPRSPVAQVAIGIATLIHAVPIAPARSCIRGWR